MPASAITISTNWPSAISITRRSRSAELIGTGKNQKRMDEVPVRAGHAYAAEDADVAVAAVGRSSSGVWPKSQLTELFEHARRCRWSMCWSNWNTTAFASMPAAGRIEPRSTASRLATLRSEIYELAGTTFNIGSPKQLQQVLFVEQKLPVSARTKTGASTDATCWKSWHEASAAGQDHRVPAICEAQEHVCRRVAAAWSTRAPAACMLVSPGRGGHGPAELQRSELAEHSDPHEQRPRNPFGFPAGRAGWLLLAADYSQIELRVLAHFSQDETLRSRVRSRRRHPCPVASQVYGVPLAEVDSANAPAAKAVNFGIIYGQSAFGLAKSLGIEQDQAAEFIDAYFNRYPGVEQFLAKILEDCLAKGYVSTVFGRRRAIRGIRAGSRPAEEPARTNGHQHRHSRLRGRPDQAGNDRHLSAIGERRIARHKDAAANPRRTSLRSARRGHRRPGPA